MIVRTMFVKELHDAVHLMRFLHTLQKLELCKFKVKTKHNGGTFVESIIMVETES